MQLMLLFCSGWPLNSEQRIDCDVGMPGGATREIAAGISNLSARTEHQASSLEETTAALQSARSQVNDLQVAVGFFKTAQGQRAEPREVDAGNLPTDNAVHAQQHKLARRVSGGGAAAALATDDEWKEF
jgi:hypothetical protein